MAFLSNKEDTWKVNWYRCGEKKNDWKDWNGERDDKTTWPQEIHWPQQRSSSHRVQIILKSIGLEFALSSSPIKVGGLDAEVAGNSVSGQVGIDICEHLSSAAKSEWEALYHQRGHSFPLWWYIATIVLSGPDRTLSHLLLVGQGCVLRTKIQKSLQSNVLWIEMRNTSKKRALNWKTKTHVSSTHYVLPQHNVQLEL